MKRMPTPHGRATRAQVETFLQPRVVEDGDCWVWQRSCTGTGHPVASIGGRRSIAVRRWAWEAWHGRSAGVLRVLCTCAHPQCVNPAHLAAVEPATMNHWLASRGRFSTHAVRMARRAVGRASSPLTEADVIEIRRRRNAGELLREIAADYPVGPERISVICRYESWAEVGNPWAGLIAR